MESNKYEKLIIKLDTCLSNGTYTLKEITDIVKESACPYLKEILKEKIYGKNDAVK